MATYLYRKTKDGIEQILIDGSLVGQHVNNGWFADKECLEAEQHTEPPKPVEVAAKEPAIKEETVSNDQPVAKEPVKAEVEKTQEPGKLKTKTKLSNTKIRKAADKAGIKEFTTKRISTLKEELGLR